MSRHAIKNNVPEYVRILQVEQLGLKPTTRREVTDTYEYIFTEWRDESGNLYFYSVIEGKRKFKVSGKDRHEMREYMKNWRAENGIG
jgi:hypothetical protein